MKHAIEITGKYRYLIFCLCIQDCPAWKGFERQAWHTLWRWNRTPFLDEIFSDQFLPSQISYCTQYCFESRILVLLTAYSNILKEKKNWDSSLEDRKWQFYTGRRGASDSQREEVFLEHSWLFLMPLQAEPHQSYNSVCSPFWEAFFLYMYEEPNAEWQISVWRKVLKN